MKKKIFVNLSALALAVLLILAAATVGILYNNSYENMQLAVRNEMEYVLAATTDPQPDFLEKISATGVINRLTLIAPDGGVIYDSVADEQSLESHATREEFIEASSSGVGEATRFSDSLGEQTYYYARRVDGGEVLRISNTVRSVLGVTLGLTPLFACIALAVLAVALFAAKKQTEAIVGPINRMDLTRPDPESCYDELSPLAARLAAQKREIENQIEKRRGELREFAEMSEQLDEGLVRIDASAKIIFANRSARRILGAQDDPAGKPLYILNRDVELSGAVDAALEGRTGKATVFLEGRVYYISATPLEGGGAAVLFLDITDRYNGEKLRREFSANVSHELKTPITSISGYAELIRDGLAAPEDVVPFADKICRESGRLIALIDDIIRLSSLDEGENALPAQNVELEKLAASVAEGLQRKADEAGVTIEVSGGGSVFCPESLVREMMTNLADNAVKYNKKGGRVEIRVYENETTAGFVVEDDGVGIPADKQERVFERFYRVDKSRSKRMGGTGLGLSIVKHIAENLGFELKLESTAGAGTRITAEKKK